MQHGWNVGDEVNRVMVVAKKVRKNFTGGKFFLFQFTDREGMLKGVLWEPGDDVEVGIQVDDIVRVRGQIQSYKGSLQLRVSEIEKLDKSDFDPADFLPASPRIGEELYEVVLSIISSVNNEDIRKLLQAIYGDEAFRESFSRAPAAKGWHHSYIGGLLEHVHDMAQLALRAADIYENVDKDILVAGVLLHDLGKLQELSVEAHIDYTDRGRLLGHITLGIEFLEEYLRGMEDFPAELELELKHMILSHHGSLENGSPVVPMTVEALLLHYIDNADAQVRGVMLELDKNGGRQDSWTEYVRMLDRFIYRGPATGLRGGGKG